MPKSLKLSPAISGKVVSIAVLIMASSNIMSRVLGYIRIKVLAHLAGTSAMVDAYSFSFLLPDIINHILAGSALSITFIPLFQKYLIDKDAENKAWHFFSNVMTIGTLFFVIMITLSFVFTESILFLAGKNIKNAQSPEVFTLTIRLTRIILPAQLFIFWGALLNGVQYAKKHFLLPGLTPLLYNIGIILGGWLLFPVIGIEGFSWGVLAGAFFGNVVVQIPGALRVGMRYKPVLKLKDSDFLRWVIITLPFILGLGMTFSFELLFRIFGSKSPDGTGALASLDYSSKIIMMIVGLFGQSVAVGIYPFLSELAAKKKFGEMNLFFDRILIKIAALTLPISGICIVLAKNIVSILLYGGKFTAGSAALTTNALIYLLPCTFFFSSVLVMSRAFYAIKNTIVPLIITTSSVLCCIPLYIYLGQHMGVKGIALSTTISTIVSFVVFIIVWNIIHKNRHIGLFIKKMVLIISVAALVIMFCSGLKHLFQYFNWIMKSVFWNNVFICLFAGAPSLLLSLILFELAGIQQYWRYHKALWNKCCSIFRK